MEQFNELCKIVCCAILLAFIATFVLLKNSPKFAAALDNKLAKTTEELDEKITGGIGELPPCDSDTVRYNIKEMIEDTPAGRRGELSVKEIENLVDNPAAGLGVIPTPQVIKEAQTMLGDARRCSATIHTNAWTQDAIIDISWEDAEKTQPHISLRPLPY